jgi:hypothetical protein
MLLGFKDQFVATEIEKQIGRQICQRLYPILGMCEHPLCFEMAVDRHHKDENTFNNDRSNVEFLCRSHHAQRHPRIRALILSRPQRGIFLSRDRVKELFLSGMTAVEIAARCGCSKNPVGRILRRLGLRRPAWPRPGVVDGANNPAWRGGKKYVPVAVKIISAPNGPDHCPRGPCAICDIPFFGRGRQKVCDTCLRTEAGASWKRLQQRLARQRWGARHAVGISR